MADTEKKTEVAEAKADKPAKADKSVPAKKKDSFGKRTAKFFREYKSELKKVVWSTPKQTFEDILYIKDNGKFKLDLWRANYRNFINAGILPENIGITDICTCCNSDLLFSHRASKGMRGGMCGFLTIKGE